MQFVRKDFLEHMDWGNSLEPLLLINTPTAGSTAYRLVSVN